jgi:hypothetical protein
MEKKLSRFCHMAAIGAALGLGMSGCSHTGKTTAVKKGDSRVYGAAGSSVGDSLYPYGTGSASTPGMGGSGTMTLDTSYTRDQDKIGSDSTWRNPSGTGLPGMQGRGGSSLDTLRGPDSMHRDSSLIYPDGYPGTGQPGGKGNGGTGSGGSHDAPMDSNRINDSLGVLDWYERG